MSKIFTPFRFIGLIFIIIGVVLINQVNDVKAITHETMDHILEPINNISHYTYSNKTIDIEKYSEESTLRISNMARSWIDLERNLIAGISVIIAGISLMICSSTESESNFWKKVFGFDYSP